MDAEVAHEAIINLCHYYPHFAEFLGRKHKATDNFKLRVGSNDWTFPVGLAAGLDKNGSCYPFLSHLGFGAVEVGTVTPLAQAGNERPRLFRIVEEESLRNSMGFNNHGSGQMMASLKRLNLRHVPLGVNIGKNKQTPDDLAFEDYAKLFECFKDLCDYTVINVSSPNTPGLRSHQTTEGLEQIIGGLGDFKGHDLFVKIAPDIDSEQLREICEVAKKYQLTGIIATNTTAMPEVGAGGVSGKMLFEKSKQVRLKCLEYLRETPEVNLIGVGGFSSFEQMKDYWKEGGRAIQIYSSFIFKGPQMLRELEGQLEAEFGIYDVKNFEEYLLAIRD